MRKLAASLVLGTLLLAGTLPAAAGQSLERDPNIVLAADDATGRSSFTQQAQYDMHQWQQKVRDFGRHTKAAGQRGAATAKHDLDDAFSKARLTADNLRTVGVEGWQGAKTAYQDASHDLANTWDRIKP